MLRKTTVSNTCNRPAPVRSAMRGEARPGSASFLFCLAKLSEAEVPKQAHLRRAAHLPAWCNASSKAAEYRHAQRPRLQDSCARRRSWTQNNAMKVRVTSVEPWKDVSCCPISSLQKPHRLSLGGQAEPGHPGLSTLMLSRTACRKTLSSNRRRSVVTIRPEPSS